MKSDVILLLASKKRMKKACCIFNYGPHYRKAIYTLMDKSLHCDFYLGDKAPDCIKKMEYGLLRGFKRELGYTKSGVSTFWYLKGAMAPILSKHYNTYITTGDSSNLTSWVLLLWSKLSGKKVILWGHGWKRTNNWKGDLLDSMYWRMADHMLIFSHYAIQHMAEKGIADGKMSCIYNSLDYDEQLKWRKSVKKNNIYAEHFGNGYPTIIYIGRLQKRKKIDLVLYAMAMLKRRQVNVNFVCVGGDDEGLALHQMAESMGLSANVWLYGALYDEKIKAELIYNSYVCVSPGNVGLTVVDALNYGTPVVTNDSFELQMPEFEAINPGLTGSFYKNGSPESLAAEIEKWIDRRRTLRWDEVAAECYKVVDEKYNPHHQMKVIEHALAAVGYGS